MIAFLLVCLLVQIHGYAKNQDPTKRPQPPPAPPAPAPPPPPPPPPPLPPLNSIDILDQLAKNIFGYTLKETANLNAKVYWAKIQQVTGYSGFHNADTEGRYLSQARQVIQAFQDYKPLQPSGKRVLRDKLADIFDKLSPEQQKEWITVYPNARLIEKLSEIRKYTL